MSTLSPPNCSTLGQRAYDELKAQILSGELEPGQRLSLRRVAAALGMSMAPVGEALRELSRDGLVETEPGWGTRVRTLDQRALRNQHILRMAVECEAARLCATNASAEELDALMEIARRLDRRIDAQKSPESIHALDCDFHLRIAELSDAESLVLTLKTNQLVRMLARGSVLAHHVDKPKQQHVRLASAIASRDADEAERAMREHCRRSMELQLSRFQG